MSTRATYEFVDEYGSHTVYKHHDGYPQGGLQWIARAIPHAWPLPRFEASDFGAAFIVGNKECAGGVRLTHDRNSHSDTEYHYTVTCRDGRLWVKIEPLWSDDPIERGWLDDLLDKYAPERGWVNEPEETIDPKKHMLLEAENAFLRQRLNEMYQVMKRHYDG